MLNGVTPIRLRYVLFLDNHWSWVAYHLRTMQKHAQRYTFSLVTFRNVYWKPWRNPSNAMEAISSLILMKTALALFGLVLYNCTIVPSTLCSIWVQVVPATTDSLYRAVVVILKSWSFISFSEIVLSTPWYSFFSPVFLYSTVVFRSIKLSSIPSRSVWLVDRCARQRLPRSFSNLFSSDVILTALSSGTAA